MGSSNSFRRRPACRVPEAAIDSAAGVPGDPGGSVILERIHSTDPDVPMPPPNSNRRLSEDQKRLLDRWIKEGADSGLHWAFTPPSGPTPPAVKQADWPRNDIDRLSIERLAGDLLPNATAEQKIAGGFNLNHLSNGDWDAIPEEQRCNTLFDRFDTTSTTWLGLTMACAQCHDHTYDPMTRTDYHRLLDAFNRLPESGVPARFSARIRVAPPIIEFLSEDNKKRVAELEGETKSIEDSGKPVREAVYEAWRLGLFADGRPAAPSAKGLPGLPGLPHIGGPADELCLVRSMNTAVNHAPGVTFFLTGAQVPGRPSLGAWMSHGLGCETEDLPSFVVMTSSDMGKTCGQVFFDYHRGSGCLPTRFRGVKFRNTGDPVPSLTNPDGVSRDARGPLLDDLAAMNARHLADYGDPEIGTWIAQDEMACRMQASVPDLVDFSDEPQHVLDRYGPDVKTKAAFAYNCLIARRLLERGTPFGRGDPANPRGRDHFGRAFSRLLAGGGVKQGQAHGSTDDHAWNITADPGHVVKGILA